MSRGGFKIQLETQRGVLQEKISKTPSWMSEFASRAQSFVDAEDSRQKSAVTSVDFAKEQNESIYERMYSIMNGKKPLYSSVEEAVNDYQSKTGLVQYLTTIEASDGKMTAKEAAKLIISASEDDAEKKKTEIDDVQLFKILPEAKGYIDNIIKNNSALSIPAILTTLSESLEGSGIQASVFDDPMLSKYINETLGAIELNTTDFRFIGDMTDMNPNNNSAEALEILRQNTR